MKNYELKIKIDFGNMSRGLNNNNPGNIRLGKDVWQGQVIPGRDRSFCEFKSMRYGYRALLKLLLNYGKIYKCVTLRDYIARWAPSTENNTEAYIRFVSGRTGIAPEAAVKTSDAETMTALAEAISFMENGVAGDESDIGIAWQMLFS